MSWQRSVAGAPLLGLLLKHRFTKFGVVGFTGTWVNLAVLYLNQEILLRPIQPEGSRLSYSLAGAIFVATVHNFLWNRHWTWRDRKGKTGHGFLIQLGQYFLASWLSIVLQFAQTRFLARWMHYLVANVVAIALAAVVNYVLNDVWTFAVRSPERQVPADRSNPCARPESCSSSSGSHSTGDGSRSGSGPGASG